MRDEALDLVNSGHGLCGGGVGDLAALGGGEIDAGRVAIGR
jgi:hypothetical protein